jgi:carnitine O-acetyltransferase
LNEDCLSTIEAASFILCLDDGSATSTVEWANNYYLGDSFNRWNDSAVHLCVASNGISGTCINHIMADGLTFHGMHNGISSNFFVAALAL